MGRMEDALRKAAEERERKRLLDRPGAAAGATSGPAHSGGIGAADPPRAEPEHRDPPPRAAHEPNTAARVAAFNPPAGRITAAPDERLIVLHSPSDPRAEQFRKLRANLFSLRPAPRVIMVTSGAKGEGKSLAAANLALTLLEIEAGDVLVVDANLRHPELAGLLAVRTGPGLSEALAGHESNRRSVVQASPIPGLSVVAAGAAGVAAARLLAPATLKSFLDEVGAGFKYIVVDTPCVTDYADATLMASDVDGVIIVVAVGAGVRESTKKAVDVLEASRARILGTMVVTSA